MMYVLIVLTILLALVGLVGALVPGIAGTPFSFLALLTLSFIDGIDYSTRFLVIMGVIGAVVFTVDYIVPVWGTKKLGGTKAPTSPTRARRIAKTISTYIMCFRCCWF